QQPRLLRGALRSPLPAGLSHASEGNRMPSNSRQYRRIAPVYDLLELPFEYGRYRRLRRLVFDGLSGRILDAGIGTGRNVEFYPRCRSRGYRHLCAPAVAAAMRYCREPWITRAYGASFDRRTEKYVPKRGCSSPRQSSSWMKS